MRKAEEPRFNIRFDVRDMNLGLLMASQAPGAAGTIEGRLEADLTLNGAGQEWEVQQKGLEGLLGR